MSDIINKNELNKLNEEFSDKEPQSIIAKAFELYGQKIVLASSFGIEDVTLIHMGHEINPGMKIITLDTGRLPEETYKVMEAIRFKYKISFQTYFPKREQVEKLVGEKGFYSFRDNIENRKECCFIRKVEPLNRALQGFDAWFTGRRRDQVSTRLAMEVFEIDQHRDNMVKVSPFANWTENDIWQFANANKVPFNSLYDKQFRSIGCEPCTRAISEGEGERAGRWWWENPDQKECGIH